MNDVHFKSGNKEWETPPAIFNPLRKEFNIVLDTCATKDNTKCKAWLDRKINALSIDWKVYIDQISVGKAAGWMNPPYGREIGRWMKKA